jgi:plastocyanin
MLRILRERRHVSGNAGLALLLVCAVVACSDGPGTAEIDATAAAAAPTTARFEVSISNPIATEPDTLRVTQGQRVELVWSSDETVTVHVHGYDIEFEVKPGVPHSLTFSADATGRFPVTVHGFGAAPHEHADEHAEHAHAADSDEMTLVYLEVHPG